MNHDKHVLTEKKFYKTLVLLNKLYKQMRALPYRAIDKPFQSGWWLIITLRDDFARSAAGPIVAGILKKFAEPVVVKSPKLVNQIRKKPTLNEVMSIMTFKSGAYRDYRGPSVRRITKKEHDALSPQAKKYFFLDTFHKMDHKDPYSLTIPGHYLVVKVKQRMITHVQDIDPVLKKEEARLERILEPYWRTTSKDQGYHHYHINRSERRRTTVEMHKIVSAGIED